MGDLQIMRKADRKRLKSRRKPDKENEPVPGEESLNLHALPLAFFAIASIIGGAIILAALWRDDGLANYWFFAVVGVLILSAGLTVLWVKSRFFRP